MNEADRTDDRVRATDAFAPDESADETEAEEIGEDDESQLPSERGSSPAEEPETEPARAAEDYTAADGDPSEFEPPRTGAATANVASGVDEPLLVDATGYQDRWYEIQTGFVDEPSRAVHSAGELLTEVMDDLMRRLSTELEAFEAHPGDDDDVSTEDLRVTFQRYRSFFDRLLTA